MRIGILGAGQLAMMLAEAAPSGHSTLCFTDQANSPASYSSDIFHGQLSSPTDLKHFAEQVDIITLENEFIAPEIIQQLKAYKPVYPDETALRITQDRLREKELFTQLNIPCADYQAIEQFTQLQTGAKYFGGQAILKTRTMGYDGKGQYRINSIETLPQLTDYKNHILEKLVPFDCEVSIIAARNLAGDIMFYPLTLNQHQAGILRTSTAPYKQPKLQQQAEQFAQKILNKLNYIGIMAIEFFVVNEELYANEIAPRVHNSGHWTIEGCTTSQFANHLRAITQQPLGTTESQDCIMHNIISEIPKDLPTGVFHDYHKTPRKNRKLGHVTQLLGEV